MLGRPRRRLTVVLKSKCLWNFFKRCLVKFFQLSVSRKVPIWGAFGQSVFFCGLQTILLAPKFHCTEEILTIIALYSVDSVLYNPPARREEVQSVRKKFISSEGDHLTLLNVYRAFKNVSGNKVGCSEVLSGVVAVRGSFGMQQ